jgi:hypothetical protein
MPDSRTTGFSLRSVTGHPGTYPSLPPERAEEGEAASAAPAVPGGSLPGFDTRDPRNPTVETLPPFRVGSGEWGAGPSAISMPSLPAVRTVEPGSMTGGIGVTWRPLDQPPAPLPGGTNTGLVPAPRAAVNAVVEAPSRPVVEETPVSASLPKVSAAPAPQRKPRRQVQRWDVVVGTLVVLVVAYLLLAGGLYAYRLWQARAGTNAVTLLQDVGHGGVSQITVTFAEHQLTVTEIVGADPQRVTILQVKQVIALPTDKVVLVAWLQAVLQPGRLDLVIQLDGGLDFPPYHPLFTTLLVNNVAALKKDPHAPGFRAPTTQELQQALRTLGT